MPSNTPISSRLPSSSGYVVADSVVETLSVATALMRRFVNLQSGRRNSRAWREIASTAAECIGTGSGARTRAQALVEHIVGASVSENDMRRGDTIVRNNRGFGPLISVIVAQYRALPSASTTRHRGSTAGTAPHVSTQSQAAQQSGRAAVLRSASQPMPSAPRSRDQRQRDIDADHAYALQLASHAESSQSAAASVQPLPRSRGTVTRSPVQAESFLPLRRPSQPSEDLDSDFAYALHLEMQERLHISLPRRDSASAPTHGASRTPTSPATHGASHAPSPPATHGASRAPMSPATQGASRAATSPSTQGIRRAPTPPESFIDPSTKAFFISPGMNLQTGKNIETAGQHTLPAHTVPNLKLKEVIAVWVEKAGTDGLQAAMEEALSCPITTLLFSNPVVAADGFTYSKYAIDHWCRDNHRSPMTRETLTTSSRPSNSALLDVMAALALEPEPDPPEGEINPFARFNGSAASMELLGLLRNQVTHSSRLSDTAESFRYSLRQCSAFIESAKNRGVDHENIVALITAMLGEIEDVRLQHIFWLLRFDERTAMGDFGALDDLRAARDIETREHQRAFVLGETSESEEALTPELLGRWAFALALAGDYEDATIVANETLWDDAAQPHARAALRLCRAVRRH
jgi:hypothetical protein